LRLPRVFLHAPDLHGRRSTKDQQQPRYYYLLLLIVILMMMNDVHTTVLQLRQASMFISLLPPAMHRLRADICEL